MNGSDKVELVSSCEVSPCRVCASQMMRPPQVLCQEPRLLQTHARRQVCLLFNAQRSGSLHLSTLLFEAFNNLLEVRDPR